MISTNQLDELKLLHKNHIANTFLFTSKLLDQRRRISDAQVEVIHGLLRDLAASASGQPAQDPAQMAQQAMQAISESLANQSARSGEFLKETAAAYAEILRLAIAYDSDTFAGLQTAGRDVATFATPPSASANPWMDSFMHSFESAANLMKDGFKPMLAAAESATAAHGADGKSAGAGRAGRAH
ncbi:MAG: hypothetical protein KGJ96_02475 [Xanthomonadaceae bacterium]|nr:hypothetical protein [Xanthomonadaceae bacterium]MDE2247421.1 hypothetical protein [Xanthomonadaceae bacterium]